MYPPDMPMAQLGRNGLHLDLHANALPWAQPLATLAQRHRALYVLCRESSVQLRRELPPELLPYVHESFVALESPDFWGAFGWRYANQLDAVDAHARLYGIARWIFLSADEVECAPAPLREKHVYCDPQKGLSAPSTLAVLDERLGKVCAQMQCAEP